MNICIYSFINEGGSDSQSIFQKGGEIMEDFEIGAEWC